MQMQWPAGKDYIMHSVRVPSGINFAHGIVKMRPRTICSYLRWLGPLHHITRNEGRAESALIFVSLLNREP